MLPLCLLPPVQTVLNSSLNGDKGEALLLFYKLNHQQLNPITHYWLCYFRWPLLLNLLQQWDAFARNASIPLVWQSAPACLEALMPWFRSYASLLSLSGHSLSQTCRLSQKMVCHHLHLAHPTSCSCPRSLQEAPAARTPPATPTTSSWCLTSPLTAVSTACCCVSTKSHIEGEIFPRCQARCQCVSVPSLPRCSTQNSRTHRAADLSKYDEPVHTFCLFTCFILLY